MSAKPTWARELELFFGAFGIALLVWCGVEAVQAAAYQAKESSKLDRIVGEKKTAPASPGRPAARADKPDHQLIGRLEIPRVRLSVVVVDGDDERTLSRAVGHLRDTPLPWEFGNSALAGHRDSFFRPLKNVRLNDRVRLLTPKGNFQYTISSIRILDPSDISVLDTKGQSSLTLVTCYPFGYIGNAPKRFVVRADHAPN